MNRWVRTKSDEAALDRGCKFNQAAADRVRFFLQKFCRHSKGQWAGQKFELLDWQWDRVVAPAFVWLMPDGTRRFRTVGVGVPKKNGKSTLLSALALYMLLGDQEPGAEVYTAAADRAQASIIFNESANMIEASDALARFLTVKRAGKMIVTRDNGCVLHALSSDVPTKEGLNIHCLLFDELHAQPNWELWNTLKYGGASRRQPMIFWISTAGVYDPTALWTDQWRHAKQVQSGEIVNLSYLGVIYEPGESDDPWSVKTWKRVNPSYGITFTERDMEEAAQDAKANPARESVFKRYRLNAITMQETKWIEQRDWAACGQTLDFADFKGRECRVGIDLSTTKDVTAAALLFKEPAGKYSVFPLFWLPERMLLKRRKEGRTPLDFWAEGGYISLTQGNAVDYQRVRQDLNELACFVKIKEIVIDPWNAMSIAADLQADGFKVEFCRMGFASIGAATKEFEKMVLDGRLTHPKNPVLDWMVGNVTVEQDAAGNIKPSKEKSAEKIDGVVAIILGLAQAMKKVDKKSVYSSRGLQVV